MGARNGGLAAEMQERRPVDPSGASLFELGSYRANDSNTKTPEQFSTHREAALALLNGSSRLTRKAGSFLGQCAVDPTPLSDAQHDWLKTLLERASLPSLRETA